jgi:hypothetical protein
MSLRADRPATNRSTTRGITPVTGTSAVEAGSARLPSRPARAETWGAVGGTD